MNSNLKWMTLIGGAVLSGVLLVALLAGTALAQGPSLWGGQGGYGWGGYGPGGMMGGGMMGRGMTRAPALPGGRSAGVGGGYGYALPNTGTRLSLDQATEVAEQYIAAYSGSNLSTLLPSTGAGQALALGEVMEFSNGFYAQAVEKETGSGAFEILIDPLTGAVYPEPGPNMMWNTRYGHMGGWGGMTLAPALPGGRSAGVGGWWGYGSQSPATGEMTVGPEAAVQAAQAYLDRIQPGLTANNHADTFYGYYTLHVLRDGQVVGMLSVNGVTGQVWYHTWHGDFIGMTGGDEE